MRVSARGFESPHLRFNFTHTFKKLTEDMNEKLFFSCDFQELLIEKILNRLTNFIRYNPDDLNRSLFKNVIEGAISELTSQPIDEIDKTFESYAKIRLYLEGKKGIHLKTDYCKVFIPDLDKESINQIQAEICYTLAYFSKLNDFLKGNVKLNDLINKNDIKTLKDILNKCTEYATYATIYRISNQKTPNKEDLEVFMNSFKL